MVILADTGNALVTLGGGFLMGARPSAGLIEAGFMLFLFCILIASGSSQAIFQSKVAPEVQGRVFATRSMISQSITACNLDQRFDIRAAVLYNGVTDPFSCYNDVVSNFARVDVFDPIAPD